MVMNLATDAMQAGQTKLSFPAGAVGEHRN